MEANISIPSELEQRLQTYLAENPKQTLSGLVQELLENKLKPKHNKILDLIGFVDSRASKPRTPEEIVQDTLERPEDEPIKQGFDRR
jgi:hypothetical protein